MKIIRSSAPKSQAWQPIRSFDQPPPAPPPVFVKPTPSNECARHAVEVASSPGGICPTQQKY
jgi:hypothetical protein